MALQHLMEGGVVYVQGSGRKPYAIRKISGVVDCSCPAWRNMGGGIDTRVCKHIKANIKPECLPKAALTRAGMIDHSVPPVLPGVPSKPAVRLTPKGKVSTAVGGAVRKDTAPPILLAETFEKGKDDPTGWWVSEKLDGVRAYWNGEAFISRLGNTFHAPESFKRSLPKRVVLDGELWLGRGRFQEASGIARKHEPTEADWAQMQYVVFDAPHFTGSFERRMDYLQGLYKGTYDRLGFTSWRVLEQVRCHGQQHLDFMLADVEAMGGEGLILRQFGSPYVTDRSTTCLKVKTFTDGEAVVVGYQPGRGKHKGRMGACVVQMADGKTFEVGGGFTDKERESPPALGTLITYKHQGFTNKGLPRIATFVAVRDYE